MLVNCALQTNFHITMTSFELKTSTGHIRALTKAVLVASRITTDAILEFTPEKMRLCARTDLFLIKFSFDTGFFDHYTCDHRHRCFINLKSLLMPFKSLALVPEKDNFSRSSMSLQCFVEDEINNQVVFKITSAKCKSTTLTYRLAINDLTADRVNKLKAISRTIQYARVQLVPKAAKADRFLLSAFNNFAPDIDQVTIKASASEVKFIGTTSPQYDRSATSEFTHKKDDFEVYELKEDTNITVPLRYLKLFLTFVETCKTSAKPRYIFEGVGQPAHFQYDAGNLFKAHFVSSTPLEFIPDQIDLEPYVMPIENGPNESFIADENVIEPAEDLNRFIYEDDENQEDEEDDWNGNETDTEDSFLDGNLDGLDTSIAGRSAHNNSISGFESIRSEMRSTANPNPEKVREILNLDQDPDEIENVQIQYSSSESDD